METTYTYANKAYKEFKNWVKTITCSGKYHFLYNTAHAIYSAYYIFKHHLNDQEITEFLDKDFNASIKSFIHCGGVLIDIDLLERVSKKEGFNFHIGNQELLNKPYYYMSQLGNTNGEFKVLKETWRNNVMLIYNYWRNKELDDIKFKRPSYEAFVKSIMLDKDGKKSNELFDVANMVWYCLKHNLSVENAEKYVRKTLNERSRINKMRTTYLLTIDAYYFQNVLNINNESFKVIERPMTAEIGTRRTTDDGKQYTSWQYYKAEPDILHTYYTNTESPRGYYKFDEICKVVNEMSLKAYEYYQKCPEIFIAPHKCCNYSLYTNDIADCIKLSTGQYLNKRRPDVYINPIEPIRAGINIRYYINSIPLDSSNINEKFKERREMYFNVTMFLFALFKSLDYIENADKISYEEFSKPIYKEDTIEKPAKNQNQDNKPAMVKLFLNKIIKK